MNQKYNEQLLLKLRCLITVVEVAIEKLSKSMADPNANKERLGQIMKNLINTLEICVRARNTLEKKMGIKPGAEIPSSQPANGEAFDDAPPITSEDIQNLDFDKLTRQLGEL